MIPYCPNNSNFTFREICCGPPIDHTDCFHKPNCNNDCKQCYNRDCCNFKKPQPKEEPKQCNNVWCCPLCKAKHPCFCIYFPPLFFCCNNKDKKFNCD